MVLKNVSKKEIEIKHDSTVHVIEPGKTLDLDAVESGLTPETSTVLANRFIGENPGLERVEDKKAKSAPKAAQGKPKGQKGAPSK